MRNVTAMIEARGLTKKYNGTAVVTDLTLLYWSKLAVLAAISLVFSLVTSFGVFFLGKALPTGLAAAMRRRSR
jgi:hypothetical protein